MTSKLQALKYFLLLLSFTLSPPTGQTYGTDQPDINYILHRDVFSTSGSTASSPEHILKFTLGQPSPTGESLNDAYVNHAGFRLKTSQRPNKAIIVAGGGPHPGNNLWEATQVCANFAYKTLLYQGYNKDTVYYLSADTDVDVDGNKIFDDIDSVISMNSIEYAVKNWTSDAIDLFIYLIDHGGEGKFRLNATEFLYASTLDAWLDSLQEKMPGKVIIVYDACLSGSFIPLLTPPAGKERVLATSTSENQDALFVDKGTVSFSFFFWGRFFNGDSFYDSYLHAEDSVSIIYGQTSMIDANGNGIPNEKIDRDTARDIRIGREIHSAGDLPLINWVSSEQTLEGETSSLIQADVFDSNDISRVWAVITPPGYSSPSPDTPVTDLPVIELVYADNNRYEAEYHHFTLMGTYKITIFAEDIDELISLPAQTFITQNDGILLLKGDINGDEVVDLADAIIVLKILAGIDASGMIRPDYSMSGVDVNGDGKIGFEELGYILQKIARLRN